VWKFKTHIIFLTLLTCGSYLRANNQDTIPPVFSFPPVDITVDCDNANADFEEWYSRNGGAIADDGEAQVNPRLSLGQALDSLSRGLTLCGGIAGSVEFGFYAIDTCGNESSQDAIATITVEDRLSPIVTVAAQNKTLPCQTGIQDSLDMWLMEIANAEAEDNCSNEVIWTAYSWQDTEGHQGFLSFDQDSTIVIQRDSCTWTVNVTFFGEDLCGNDFLTNASFVISGDQEPPYLASSNLNATTLCELNQGQGTLAIMDDCDGNVTVNTDTFSTQDPDASLCGHYNYTITTDWMAVDKCGNTFDTSTILSVVDTIPPIITGEPNIAINCDINLTTSNNFIEVTDNCSQVTITYSDDIIFTSICQEQLKRKWYATDICGNIDSLEQFIQIQDFTGPTYNTFPRDTIVQCSSSDLDNLFTDWLTRLGGGIASDDCSEFSIVGLVPGIYTDTTDIISADSPKLNLDNCDNIIAITSQQVSYVAFDACGNVSQREALFTVIDNTPPSISECPSDFNLDIVGESCAVDYTLRVPTYSDDCLLPADAEWSISLNGSFLQSTKQEVENLKLGIGLNTITYTISDCGSNTASCIQSIDVKDTSPPLLVCPNSRKRYLSEEECTSIHSIVLPQIFDDNCNGLPVYDKRIPQEEELIIFRYNRFTDNYEAADFLVDFTDVALPDDLFTISLDLEYSVQLDPGSTISLRDEDANIVYTIDESNCINTTINIPITEKNKWRRWSEDGVVRFVFLHNRNNGAGTIPCQEENILDDVGDDGQSYLRLRLHHRRD